MARKSPAFSCYPKDLLSDAKVAKMSNEEFGAYWRLVCFSWEEPLPSDLGDLALMLPRTTKKQMERMWRVIGPCFTPHPTEAGKLIQARIEQEREKQALHREKQGENGRKGGRPKKPNDNPSETQEKAMGSSEETESEAKKNLSSSSSSSGVANATSSEGGAAPKLPIVDEATLAARAILSAVWPKVQSSVAGAMTKTEWGKRNMRYARDLVAAGASVDAILAAHASASRRLGKTVQMLSLVQSELASKNDKPASPYANLQVVGKSA